MKDFKSNRKMSHGEPTNMCWGGAMKKARGGYAEGGMRSESTQNARAKRELSDAYEDVKPSYNPIKNWADIFSGRAMEKGAALSNALDRKKRADAETGEYKKGGMAKGGKNWIAGAIKHKGALHRDLGVPMGQKIPASKLAKAEHSSNPTIAKRARLAKTLASFK